MTNKTTTIPKEWYQVKLSDICVIKKGTQLNRLVMNRAGEYPAINGGIEPSGYTDNWNAEKGTVTISEGGNSCGFVNLIESRFWCGGHCYQLLNIGNNIQKIFLYQYLKYKQEDLMKLRVGTGLPNIQKKKIEDFAIVVPPLPEQKEIADILTSVDEEIHKTDEIINQTEKLKNGLMRELFTKGIGHKKFKKTKVGDIPNNWGIVELKEVSQKIGDGLHGTPKYSEDSEYYFINGNNITNWQIQIYPETKKISLEEYQNNKKELTNNTIFLSINGTIGNIGFYNNEKVMLGKSIAYINVEDKFIKEFIAYQLTTQRVKDYFIKNLTGTTIKNLSLATLRNTPIVVPPYSEQKLIADIISTLEIEITQDQQQKEKLSQLKKGLMQDLLSGRVRVKV